MEIAVHSISFHVINGVLSIQGTGAFSPYALSGSNIEDKLFYKGAISLSGIAFSQPTLSFRLDSISLESDKGSPLSYSLNGGPFGEYSESKAIKDDTSLTVKTKEQSRPSFFLSSKVTVTINEAP